MPRLTIDNKPVEVPSGTTVLEAAKQVGIWIPHFCYHPALGSVGACRLCAMKFLDGPIKGIQMSCMIPAQDGMVVSTTDGEAARMRQLVIEWLMLNHPHDCPVCDEGGECLLQDYTIAGGHGIRRFTGKKRTHLNQYLGPYIEHEMNRCIQCYRCVRFYQEFAGGSDFGVMGSAARVYFGRQQEGALASPFSGNLVDICPTGVFTDKTARFRARYWDYEMAPSVCPHCSLGCTTTPAARYRELLKVIARRNDAVNGWFICNRGRFSNSLVNDPQRPRAPQIDGREASWDEALETLLTRIQGLHEVHGPASLAIVGSPRLTLEGNLLLARLAQTLDSTLCYFVDNNEAVITNKAISKLTPDNVASMADVQGADLIALAACDLLEEGPMMAMAVRQAWRKGASVFAVDAAESDLLAKEVGIGITRVNSLAEIPFAEAKRPVVICGTALGNTEVLEKATTVKAKLAFLLTGPNAFGAGQLARENEALSLDDCLESGKIKGIIAFEADLPPDVADQVQLLAMADWLPTAAQSQAGIFLPTTAWVEMDGTFVNNEGRAQRFRQVMQPGLPLKGLDPARHPPRIHRRMPPGGDPQPSWQIIAKLLDRLDGEKISEPFCDKWAKLRELDAEGEGLRVLGDLF